MSFAPRRSPQTGSPVPHRSRPHVMPGEQLAAADALRIMRAVEAQARVWFWRTDEDGRLIYLSASIAEQIVPPGDDPLGLALGELFSAGGESESGQRTLRFHLNARTSFVDFEVRAMRRIDDHLWSISGRPLFDDSGAFTGFAGSGTDLTGARRAEAEASRLALHDPLTGLANRTRTRQFLDQSLLPTSRRSAETGLLLIDLDRFKAVNDTLGHQVGDALLVQVGQRLRRIVEGEALVGRLGGDEFQVIVARDPSRGTMAELAARIIANVSKPYIVNNVSLSIGCSIGLAISPGDGIDAEMLTRSADLALYAAKDAGRGIFRFFEQTMLDDARLRKELEDDLRQALARGQLRLVYQPVVRTSDGRISGYEALARWDHPKRGPISPTLFIGIAEEAGLIDTIGEWVLREACMAAAKWPAEIRIAVNASPIQFLKPGFPVVVASALAHSGLPADRLELEITESVFIDGGQTTDQAFRNLKNIGVRLALDDFGTGYSSLGYLRTAPFDKIKIDQTFVRGAKIAGNRSAAIIKAIVALADALGVETTAEGVELLDEVDYIRELGCSHIQGFVYGKPIDEATVKAQLGVGLELEASGFKTSRPERMKLFRQIHIRSDSARVPARVRNISSSGAMIEAFEPLSPTRGAEVTLDFGDQGQVAALVRWVRDGKAGLEFVQSIDFRAMVAARD